MKEQIISLGFIVFFIGCSSPLDKKFNTATVNEEIAMLKSTIDTVDFKILAESILRLEHQKSDVVDIESYKEIIAAGKEWSRAQEKIERQFRIVK